MIRFHPLGARAGILAGLASGCGPSMGPAAHADATPQVDAAVDGVPDGAVGPPRWLVGYYAAYDVAALPVDEIAWQALTHIAVSFYVPDGHDGVDPSLGLGVTQGPALGHALVTAAHANGKQAIATIGGPTQHDALALAASAPHRAAFVTALVGLVAGYGYDGIDLDWEPITPTDVPTLTALAHDLRAALPGASLSVPILAFNMNAVPPMAWFLDLVPLFDRINVMTYGMSGVHTGWKSWHSSPLHWNQDVDTPVGIDATVDALLAAGIPPSKLGIGAGFYGECYRSPVQKPLQPLGHTTLAFVDYAVIASTYLPAGTRVWDDAAKVPYLSFATPHAPDSCTYITYEDAESLTEKAAYARTKGLGGMIVWSLNQGYEATAPVGQRNQLLEALAVAFAQ